MRKSQNIKVNLTGAASCLVLLLLAGVAISPITPESAFAEEIIPQDGDTNPANATNTNVAPVDNANSETDLMATAIAPSTVNISFSPAAGSTSLTPTTSAGQSAQINVLSTVNVQNSGGYSVYIKSNTQNLVGKQNSTNLIPGINGSVAYNNLQTNTWGYFAHEGTAVPENATYKAVSVTGNGDKITENTNNRIVSDTKQIMLSFVAKIGNDKPADTYQNTIIMSVVSSPYQAALTDIAEMQQMTSKICEATPTATSKQLKDTRDGKYYWVAKLPDEKCWMTQNLDLDLSTDRTLTNTDTDLQSPTTSYKPTYTTATSLTASTVLASNTGQRSWSLGDYRLKNPTTSSSCGIGKNSAANCANQFTPYTTPTTANNDANAHYILGNHYQWNAATAGTGGSITSGEAGSSICPFGWRLPTSSKSGASDFQTLMTAGAIGTSVSKLTSAPYYFARGGYASQFTDPLFSNAGDQGTYWSSSPTTTSANAYNFNFNGSAKIVPDNDTTRQYGFSVRCVAR